MNWIALASATASRVPHDMTMLSTSLATGASSFTLEKDVITIAPDGSWSEATTCREAMPGQVTIGTDADGETWTRSGSSVSLYSSVYSSTAYDGTYSKGRPTFNSLGFVFVLVRQ